jgi:hypothetical protein
MKKLSAIVGLVASLAASGGAQATLLHNIQGDVRVNRGSGYVVVRGITRVNTGDTVMVDAHGKARLLYPDGCDEEVQAGSATTVNCSRRLGDLPLALGGGAAGAALAAAASAPQDAAAIRPASAHQSLTARTVRFV